MQLRILVAAALLGSAGFASLVRGEAPDVDAAKDVVLRALQARSENRNDDYAALVLPQDLEDLKRTYVERWRAAGEVGQAQPFTRMFPGVGSSGHLEKMDAAEVFALAESVKKPAVPGPPPKYRVVGSAIDGDVTYIAVSPWFGGVDLYPCFAMENGDVRLGLHVDDRTRIRTHFKKSELKAGGATDEEISRQLTPESLSKIEVLTLVTDEKSVWIVGKATATFPDREESAVGLYQVGGRGPLIDLLDKEDPTSLDDQRRAAIEAEMMRMFDSARAKRASQ